MGSTSGYLGLGRLLKEHFDSLIVTHKLKSINGLTLIRTLPSFQIPNKDIEVILVTSPSSKIPLNELKHCTVIYKEESLHEKLRDHYVDLLTQTNLKANQKIETFAKSSKPLRKVVCIDDDRILHRILDLSFKSLPDLSTKFCADSNQAVDMVLEYQPDLILLDVMMEGLSGPEVFAKLKAAKPKHKFPVIFLTGKSRKKEIKELEDLGCIGVISKPFKPRELSEQVQNIWHQYHGSAC
ncbi:MAG: response regulator [Oligoflexales bacterium]|nr:response regulator [Oligoflexales bacterium]